MTLDVDLWIWPLDQPDRVTGFSRLLSGDETARAVRFVRPQDKLRYITGRGRMREIIGQYMGLHPDAVSFSYGAQDKPELPGGPAFNLSHANGWAALIVAPAAADRDIQLGVDIEAERPVEDGVAARFFSPSEYASLSALPATDWKGGFFRCWTRKEAVIKATGGGLSTPLDSFDVSLMPGDAAQIKRVSGDLAPVAAWSLTHLDLAPRFVGAIAAVTHGRQVRVSVKETSLPLW
ncbi:MAG: 4'-phosphopantetheinyl transferase [Paracoccaceae bacterium]